MPGMSWKSLRAAIALTLAGGLVLAAPSPSLAGAKGERPAAAAPLDLAAQDAQEAADSQVVQSALEALKRSGASGLRPRLTELRTILNRAPASYPLMEDRGAVVIVRSDNPALSLLAVLPSNKGDRSVQVETRFNTYVYAALLLGWYANETKQPEEALEVLNAGLALQPGDAILTSEKSAALGMLKRFPEALAANDLALAQPLIEDVDRARLLRNRGFALIELGRLDEAETAYKESLKLEPGNPGALNELEYIRQLRAGAPPTAPEYNAGGTM